jgi:hypothetical protein
VFFTTLVWDASPKVLGEVIQPGANRQFDPERLVLQASQGEDLRHTVETGEVVEPARGAPPIGLVRT